MYLFTNGWCAAYPKHPWHTRLVGKWGTRHDETTELPSEKKTGETYEQKSQWLKNTDFRLIFSSLVASYSLVATVEDDVTWKVHASWDGIFPQKVEWTHLKSNQVRQMRFHTCILKGPIPFMTHSSLLISNVNCWSGMLPQSKTARPWFITKNMHQSQHVKMPKTFNRQLLLFHQSVVQLHLPSIKRSILKKPPSEDLWSAFVSA